MKNTYALVVFFLTFLLLISCGQENVTTEQAVVVEESNQVDADKETPTTADEGTAAEETTETAEDDAAAEAVEDIDEDIVVDDSEDDYDDII